MLLWVWFSKRAEFSVHFFTWSPDESEGGLNKTCQLDNCPKMVSKINLLFVSIPLSLLPTQ